MRLRGRSPRTIQTYLAFHREFLQLTGKKPENVTVEDVRRFQEHLMGRGLSIRRVNLGLSALRFYYDTILGKGLFANYERPRPPERLPVVLTKEEVRRLIGAAGNLLAELVLKLLYATGLRLSECAHLRTRDLDLDQGRGWVRGGKGGRDRPFRIAEHLAGDLRRHLAGRREQSEWVFPGRHGSIAPRTIQKWVADAARRAGIQKRVTVHTLRHSFATHLFEAGYDIRKIQVLLGHRRLSTTEIYTRVSPEELAKVPSPLDLLYGEGDRSRRRGPTRPR